MRGLAAHDGVDAGPRWGLGLRRVHALSAMVLLVAATLGLAMTHVVRDPGLKFELYQWHKSVGVTVFALLLLRVGLRLRHPSPQGVGTALQRRLAAVTHRAFYVLMLVLPLTGWAMVSASPLPVPTIVFGLFTLPPLLSPDMARYQALKGLHGWLAWGFCFLALVHVAGAAAHWRRGLVSQMWLLWPKAR